MHNRNRKPRMTFSQAAIIRDASLMEADLYIKDAVYFAFGDLLAEEESSWAEIAEPDSIAYTEYSDGRVNDCCITMCWDNRKANNRRTLAERASLSIRVYF